MQRQETQTILVSGPVGQIEVFCDFPLAASQGIVLIAHPQPLMGGSAAHKIPHLLAKLFQQLGYSVFRPNFRGVGHTAGTHDHGEGETDDLEIVTDWLLSQYPNQALILVGFSFGAYVQTKLAERLAQRNIPLTGLFLLGTPSGTVESKRVYHTPLVSKEAVVIHGETDEIAPLTNLLDWIRPQGIPVILIPGANHFFSGKLIELQNVIKQKMRLISLT
ncbi:alpha/beta fold hydrolase [Leeia sp. TBRC 13508]|uniref:Alpha/beta fold hydrolase n=1 Tax=Leeia speluncae TaxID=2884804 RepID=A0ABS8D9Z1_9NEIS|nr:alpha/beta fold hydrolase [Leeia speluncae]MCB6185020.1 alpha/beta fold hydrolase [Leeia speluncae]